VVQMTSRKEVEKSRPHEGVQGGCKETKRDGRSCNLKKNVCRLRTKMAASLRVNDQGEELVDGQEEDVYRDDGLTVRSNLYSGEKKAKEQELHT